MLGCDHISHYSEFVVSSTLSIYSSTLVAIELRDYDAGSYTIVDFHLFYDGAVDMKI